MKDSYGVEVCPFCRGPLPCPHCKPPSFYKEPKKDKTKVKEAKTKAKKK